MRKWGIALAAAGLLAGGATAADLRYVPVDTSRNLAAPVQVYGRVVPKKSWLGRVGDSVKSLSPFSSKKGPTTPPGPVMPAVAAAGSKLINNAAALAGTTHGISGSAR